MKRCSNGAAGCSTNVPSKSHPISKWVANRAMVAGFGRRSPCCIINELYLPDTEHDTLPIQIEYRSRKSRAYLVSGGDTDGGGLSPHPAVSYRPIPYRRYSDTPPLNPGWGMTPACLRCGDKALRRWRSVSDPNNITCWVCWNCIPPPPGLMVDILALVRAEPRTLLALPSERVDEHFFRDLAEFGAAIAIDLRPCRSRLCAPR